MRTLSVYFAHPTNTYGTDAERDALALLRREFPSPVWQIVTPNRPDWQEGYRRHGMQFFIERCGECDACVYMTFPSGKIGAGVAKEVASFLDRGARVWRLDGDALVPVTALAAGDILSVGETRALLRSGAA